MCNTNKCGTNPWTCLKPYVVRAGLLVCFLNLSIRNFLMGWFGVFSGSLSSLRDSFLSDFFSAPSRRCSCQISWVGSFRAAPREPRLCGHCSPGQRMAWALLPAFPSGMKWGEVPVQELLKLLANCSHIWQKDWWCKVNQKARASCPGWEIRFAAAFCFCRCASPPGLWNQRREAVAVGGLQREILPIWTERLSAVLIPHGIPECFLKEDDQGVEGKARNTVAEEPAAARVHFKSRETLTWKKHPNPSSHGKSCNQISQNL